MGWQEEYRKHFPVTSKCVYLDVGYDCGGSDFGRAGANRHFDNWVVSAASNERGGPGRGVFFRELDELREMLNKLINGEGPKQFAFTRNTNEGFNEILQGFDFQPGDNIVVAGHDHTSVLLPALNLRKLKNVELKILKEPANHQLLAEDLISLCDEHTRMVLCSHIQSATGWTIDLEKLGAFTREKGIYLIVDAIQSLGIVPFDAKKWGVDGVCAAAYKGLSGVISFGFVYGSKDLMKHIWPIYGAEGFGMEIDYDNNYEIVIKEPETAKKLENSSLDNLGGYVLHDALKEILNIGVENIWQHVNRLYDRLYEGMSELGYDIITSKTIHGGSLAIENVDLQDMFNFFRSKNIVLSITHSSYIRLSIGAFNNDEDIDYALKVAKEYKEKRK